MNYPHIISTLSSNSSIQLGMYMISPWNIMDIYMCIYIYIMNLIYSYRIIYIPIASPSNIHCPHDHLIPDIPGAEIDVLSFLQLFRRQGMHPGPLTAWVDMSSSQEMGWFNQQTCSLTNKSNGSYHQITNENADATTKNTGLKTLNTTVYKLKCIQLNLWLWHKSWYNSV